MNNDIELEIYGEKMVFHHWKNITPGEIIKVPRFTKNRKRRMCSSEIVTFDIETTTLNKEIGWCYLWQLCINGVCIYGRYLSEFVRFIKMIADYIGCSEDVPLIIWIHNLGYEFQFIRNFLPIDHVFASQSRRPIRVKSGCLEFRCSYKLTNKSLDYATRNQRGVKHPKQKEKMDFEKIRYPDSELTAAEWSYSLLDVLSLFELIKCMNEENGDTLLSMPTTSTGYIRRKMRNRCRKDPGYRDYFLRNKMSVEVYKLLKEAARGGNTHANRAFSGRIMENVRSFDKRSCYPAVMLLKKYPSTAFVPLGEIEKLEELEQKIAAGAALLFRVTWKHLRIREGVTVPYIPYSKCKVWGEFVNDNGRIVHTKPTTIVRMTMTDIDWQIIKRQYQWDAISISDVYASIYDDLPEPIREGTLAEFRTKSEIGWMKDHGGLTGGAYADTKIAYNKSKNELNGIFGMMYTDPVRSEVVWNGTEWKENKPDTDEEIEEKLQKFYRNRNSFLVYAVGVWITAWARYELQNLIDAIGSGHIYNDTDSGKGVIDEKAEKEIERQNKEIIRLAEERGAYADVHGIRYHLGVNEEETTADRFITLGAKKYCYESGGELHLTVSGVNPERGAEELGCIENFKPEFLFTEKSKGIIMHFIDRDEVEVRTIEDEEGRKHRVEYGSCITATKGTYLLGLSSDYETLLRLIEENEENDQCYGYYYEERY